MTNDNERGFALVIAILTLGALATVLGAYFLVTGQERSMTRSSMSLRNS